MPKLITTIRETPNFIATAVPGGVRITAKEPRATPKSRVVRPEAWEDLSSMSDSEFDGSCVMDLGIGAFRR